MSSIEYEKARLEAIGKAIYFQIILYLLFGLTFFIFIYENIFIYYISTIGVYIILIYLIHLKRKSLSLLWKFLSIIFICGFPIIIFFTYNIYHNIIFALLINPIGLESNFDFNKIVMYYGYLTLFAILSEVIILFYYYKKYKGIPSEESYGLWGWFIKDLSWKKVFLLILLLSIASFFEEIMFRFMIINIGLTFGIHLLILIIASTIIFGLMHYQNGGWLYTINSTFAGIFFALCFIELGLYPVTFLHFLWNFLVVFQMLFPYWLDNALKEKEKTTNIINYKRKRKGVNKWNIK